MDVLHKLINVLHDSIVAHVPTNMWIWYVKVYAIDIIIDAVCVA